MYYKIVYDFIVIDIISNPRWVRWLKNSRRFLFTDPTSANGLVSSDGSCVFNLENRGAFDGYKENYKTVSFVEIPENEYNYLKSQITEKTIDADGVEIPLRDLIPKKIVDMSQQCEATINAGFDIVLSDGISHHFSLHLPDQLKISKLREKAVEGEKFLPYHADNEPCKFYPAKDIIAINAMMEATIEYHTTYFNSLKMYIGSLTDKNEIIDFKYGSEIPEGYQSDVLKLMLSVAEGGERNENC